MSCLCSELAECKYSEDNGLDVLPNIFQVKSSNYRKDKIYILHFHVGGDLPGTLCHQPRVWLLHLVILNSLV